VNQSRIKIANSDGAKKIKQYKTKFILLITQQRFLLGISYITGSNGFRRVGSARLPSMIPNPMLSQKILEHGE
jgi:hypothetical protein